jgi:hypothetical protein
MTVNKFNAIVDQLPENTWKALKKISEGSGVSHSTVNRVYHGGIGQTSVSNAAKIVEAINKEYNKKITLDELIDSSVEEKNLF